MTRIRLVALIASAVLVAAGCSGDDDEPAANDGSDRTVHVDMVDIAFEPEELEVRVGETVRFVFENHGDAVHDAFIGDREAQVDHEAEMAETEDGHNPHDGITVDPGDTADVTHTFREAGAFEIGCHQPGHYDAGMKVNITVA